MGLAHIVYTMHVSRLNKVLQTNNPSEESSSLWAIYSWFHPTRDAIFQLHHGWVPCSCDSLSWGWPWLLGVIVSISSMNFDPGQQWPRWLLLCWFPIFFILFTVGFSFHKNWNGLRPILLLCTRCLVAVSVCDCGACNEQCGLWYAYIWCACCVLPSCIYSVLFCCINDIIQRSWL